MERLRNTAQVSGLAHKEATLLRSIYCFVCNSDAVHKRRHAASAAGQGWCNDAEPGMQKDYLDSYTPNKNIIYTLQDGIYLGQGRTDACTQSIFTTRTCTNCNHLATNQTIICLPTLCYISVHSVNKSR